MYSSMKSGVVVEAVPVDGPSELRDEARTIAMAMRYRPFVQDGDIVRARFNVTVVAAPADYHGPADRAFPQSVDLSGIHIRLVRGGCYASCPDYELEISGDGRVRYVGHANVAREGEHTWTISRERVAELVDVFRQADYFNLKGYYVVPIFHMPLYVTSIRVGEQEKFVVDYGSSLLQASVGQGRSTIEDPFLGVVDIAPASVAEIENAIDRIAGVEPYVGVRDE